LKGRPLVAGVVGADEDGTRLRAALEQAGVNPDSLISDRDGRPTTVKLRILAQNQQIVRLDRELRTPISTDLENKLLAWLECHLHEVQACILSDYGKGVLTPRIARQAIAMCRTTDIPVLVDPKRLDAPLLRGATLVKPNKHEAERLVSREIFDDAGFLEAGNELAEYLAGTAILITRGAQGMSLFRQSTERYDVVTAARNVYDVTGAGDTVIGTLALALAANATLEQAVWLAAQSAAIVVGKLGTSTITLEELTEQCRQQR
jgi:D-beta-D-heptose 7-phosphate kinase/D-beta-D-heptose 1-phosphate adenosyltransferase